MARNMPVWDGRKRLFFISSDNLHRASQYPSIPRSWPIDAVRLLSSPREDHNELGVMVPTTLEPPRVRVAHQVFHEYVRSRPQSPVSGFHDTLSVVAYSVTCHNRRRRRMFGADLTVHGGAAYPTNPRCERFSELSFCCLVFFFPSSGVDLVRLLTPRSPLLGCSAAR